MIVTVVRSCHGYVAPDAVLSSAVDVRELLIGSTKAIVAWEILIAFGRMAVRMSISECVGVRMIMTILAQRRRCAEWRIEQAYNQYRCSNHPPLCRVAFYSYATTLSIIKPIVSWLGSASITSFFAFNCSTSQFDHKNLPLRKSASGLQSQTAKLAGRSTTVC
jgi:hypothetical protein